MSKYVKKLNLIKIKHLYSRTDTINKMKTSGEDINNVYKRQS